MFYGQKTAIEKCFQKYSIILICILSAALQAQDDLYFESISNTGLFTPVTRALTADSLGYLYVGTNDGFYRYDGYAFSKYPSAAAGNLACPIHNVRALCFDGNNLWLGGTEGLAKMQIATNEFQIMDLGLPDKNAARITVRCIQKISKNLLCAGSYEGVALIDIRSDAITFIPMPDMGSSTEFSYISSMDTDAQGNVWLGTQRNGLFILFPEKKMILPAAEVFKELSNFSGTVIHEVLNYTPNEMLISTEDGLWRVNTLSGKWQSFFEKPTDFATINPDVRSIVKMQGSNNLLITTHGDGLFYYRANEKYLQHYTYNDRWTNSLNENFLNDIIYGGNGIYWIATENAGIVKMDTWFARYKFVLLPDLLNDNFVLSVNDLHKTDQNYWLATSSGLFQYAGNFKYLSSAALYDRPYLQNINQLNRDILTFQVWNEGVGTYNMRTGRFGFLQMPSPNPEGNTAVFDWLSFVDDNANYYLTDFDGNYFRCNYITGSVDTLFTPDDVNLSLPIVIPHTTEKLWIISASGLYQYNSVNKNLKHIVADAKGNRIPPVSFQEDIIVDEGGMVYIASDEGFFAYSSIANNLKHYTIADGLPSNNCFSLFEDPEGNIHIMFSDGMAKFNKQTEKFTYTPLPKLVASSPTPFYSNDNYFYLGADNCFIQVHRDSITAYSGKSFMRVLTVTAGNKTFPVNDFSEPIVLQYKDFPIVITYEIIDYADAGRNRVQYMMTGWDAEIIDDKNRSLKAIYSKLTAGEYEFVLVSGSKTGSQLAEIRIPILVKPPYWQTWWFIGSAIILLLAIPYGIYRYRLNALLRIQDLRNKIALDLHDEVGSSLSSIRMLSEMAVMQKNNTDILAKISANASEIVEKMNDIIWMINPKYDQTSDIIKKLDRYLQQVCSAKNITYRFTCQGIDQVSFSMQQRKNIFLIMKEGINNAAKYSGTEKLEVALQKVNDKVIITIQDFGVGFDMHEIQPGNGLDSMRLRAHELKGVLQITTQQNEGTLLQITFQA